MIRALASVLVALAACAAACGGSASDPSDAAHTISPVSTGAAAACSPARARAAGDYVETLVLGIERRYFVRVPSGYTGLESVPVVLAFPASEMPGSVFAGMSELPPLADAEAFLLVVVESAGEPAYWNSLANPEPPDDLAYALATLDAIGEAYCVDQARVYAVGFSGGGGMAQAAACAAPDRIAALAVVASTFLPCRANVPMLAFHGTGDQNVPYEGGTLAPPADQSQTFPSVRRGVTEWARGLGCDPLATISRPSSEVELSTFKRCSAGDGVVLLYSVIGGGHTWPGSPPLTEAFGFSTQQLDAAAVMWQFFESSARR